MENSPVWHGSRAWVGNTCQAFLSPRASVQEGSSTGTGGLGRREVVRAGCSHALEGNSSASGVHTS